MKKVYLGLGLASLFITGVLLSLLQKGVFLKEREMVKWSSVMSSQEAGRKLARFYFPLIKEFESIHLVGPSLFAQTFFKAFQKEALANWPEAQLLFNQNLPDNKSFEIQILPMDTVFREKDQNQNQNQNQNRDKMASIILKAHKKFLKKERNQSLLWINMYRLSFRSALLIFREP